MLTHTQNFTFTMGMAFGHRGPFPGDLICITLTFPDGSDGKESLCTEGDLGLIPGLGRSPGEEKGYPLQYSGLENFMCYIVHGVTKTWTRLNDFQFSLVTQLCLTLCNPMNCSMPGLPVHHQLPEFTQTQVH